MSKNKRVDQAMAIAEAIRQLGSIPSGHLYARLMGYMSLDYYESLIRLLLSLELIRQDSSHLLTWNYQETGGYGHNPDEATI